jgi:predicted regulator of Ras-like GTPase activity (Roadblock/LC7/MglB family)
MLLEYRVDQLQRVLAQLCHTLEGARAAVVVSIEGLVVASYPPEDGAFLDEGMAHSSQVAAMASIMVSLAERTLTRLGLSDGTAERLLIEGPRGSIIVLPVNPEVALAVVLEKEAKPGIVFHVIPRAAQQIQQILRQ